MQDKYLSKDKFFSLDSLISIFILTLSIYVLYSSAINRYGASKELDPEVLSRVRSSLYSAEEANKPTLVIFTTSWCGVCRALEEELKKRNMPYLSVDIENSSESYRLYQDVWGTSSGPVPVTIAGKKVVVGNQLDKIISGLKEVGYQL